MSAHSTHTSTLRRLFQTNDAPSTDDTNLIHELLNRKEDEIKELDLEIVKAEEAHKTFMDRLLEQRNAVQGTADAHQAIITPLRRFPPEMLSEIFKHCLHDQNSYNPPETRAPMKLCWVSQKWRAVALSTPSLWTWLSDTIVHREVDVNRRLARANFWLKQSRSLPLGFYFHCNVTRNFSTLSDIMQLVDTYFSHASRWKRVNIELSSWGSRTLPPLPDVIAPQLETATFTLGLEEADVDWSLNLLRSTSSLRHLSWNSCAKPLLGLTLSNLRILRIDGHEPSMAVSALHFLRLCQLAPQLRDFSSTVRTGETLSRLNPEDAVALKELCVVHATLESIHMTHLEAGDFGTVFNQLTLPALKVVNVQDHFNIDKGPWPAEAFHAMLSRSSCALTSLTLEHFSITSQQVIELLKHDAVKDSLKTLELSLAFGAPPKCILPDSLLNFLSGSDPQAASWERKGLPLPLMTLESIGLAIEPSSQFDLVRDIISRRTSEKGSNLKKVYLDSMEPVFDNVQVKSEALDELVVESKEAGVDVHLLRLPIRYGHLLERLTLRPLLIKDYEPTPEKRYV